SPLFCGVFDMKLGGQGGAVESRPRTEPASRARIEQLRSNLASANASVGIIGMGYVGQPLAIAAHERGFSVVGFDIDPGRVVALNDGHSTIRTIPDSYIATMLKDGRFRASNDLEELSEVDVIVICVPTPLSKNREPDLTHVKRSAKSVGAALRRDQLVCL